jgi:hypothetical protein
MKVNEAPEKIYLYPSDIAGEEYEDEWGTFPWGEGYVEYTRIDAFIKKASAFIRERLIFDDNAWYVEGEVTLKDKVIEDFKNYMKGE